MTCQPFGTQDKLNCTALTRHLHLNTACPWTHLTHWISEPHLHLLQVTLNKVGHYLIVS